MIYLHTYQTNDQTSHNFYNPIDEQYYCAVTFGVIQEFYYIGNFNTNTTSGIFFNTCDKFKYKLPIRLVYTNTENYFKNRLSILENDTLNIILNSI